MNDPITRPGITRPGIIRPGIIRQATTSLVGAALLAASLASPALAQGTQQTVSLMQVDPATLATGYRTSKVVGSTVVNEANVPVGTIDDLIVTPNEKVPFAVLSVGGFLGIGTKFVVVPFSELQNAGPQGRAYRRHQGLAERASSLHLQNRGITLSNTAIRLARTSIAREASS
jgi:hypothetical protein